MDLHASAMLDETVERNSERNGVTEGEVWEWDKAAGVLGWLDEDVGFGDIVMIAIDVNLITI